MEIQDYAIAVVAVLFFVGYGALLYGVGSEDRTTYCAGKTVTEIGGCGAGGICGVKWSNGTFGFMKYPVVGQNCK